MAGNSKIIYKNTTLIDLTQDTVAVDKVLEGYTFHDKTGDLKIGTMQEGGGSFDLDSLVITTPATKSIFKKGDSIDLTGLVVTGTIGHMSGDVTQDCTVTPTVFTELGENTVTLTYGGLSVSYEVTVTNEMRIVPWATGTDLEIIAMLNAYYNDDLDIYSCEGWELGAEREVQLSAMPATGVNESHVAQTVKLILLDRGARDLVTPINGHTKCAFVVGQGNVLKNGNTVETGYVHNNYYDVQDWAHYKRRAWCNDVYRNALSEPFRSIFKQFYNPTLSKNSLTVENIEDYFTLPSVSEIFPSLVGRTHPYEDTYTRTEGSALAGYSEIGYDTYPKLKGGSYWFRSIPLINDSRFDTRANGTYIEFYDGHNSNRVRVSNADRADLCGFAPQGVI